MADLLPLAKKANPDLDQLLFSRKKYTVDIQSKI